MKFSSSVSGQNSDLGHMNAYYAMLGVLLEWLFSK